MERTVSQAIDFIWNTLQCGVERLDAEAKEFSHEGEGKETTYKLSGYKVGSNYRIDIKPQG